MLEEGLTRALIEALAAEGIAAPGGFPGGQLPKDQMPANSPSAWAYRSFALRSGRSLKGENSWTEVTWQIDCHGVTMADAILLAQAVQVAMRSIRGVLSDSDATQVVDILFEDQTDGSNDASRTYVRSLDFLIQYHRQ